MDLILKYFPDLTPEQKKQLSMLTELYTEWNEKINLISRKDIGNLEEKHILHSLAIAKIINFKPGTKVMDVGTGGGFPGIPLAILFPDVDFLLVDSVGKKIKVVNEIITATGLKNVKAIQKRAEEVEGRFDFIVSRAVTRLPLFISWVKRKISYKQINSLNNGILYLKGGDIEQELGEIREHFAVYDLDIIFQEEFFHSKKAVYVPLHGGLKK
jgi:16S rRNA (guanine527-N7)-methyltransferase